jgi:parallel beta-helix repeat protein
LSRKIVFGIMQTLLLTGMLVLVFSTSSITFTISTGLMSSQPVHNLNTGLNYSTIQEAINAPETLNGHTIYIKEGTYYENVVMNKSLSLIGESRSTTIIDGNYTGNVIEVTTDSVNITDFTVQGSGGGGYDSGIYVTEGTICSNISYNIITSNRHGIYVCSSSFNILYDNVVTNNTWGIYLYGSSNNSISNNKITNNKLQGVYISHFSDTNSVYRNNITANAAGVYLELHSRYNSIRRNSITNHSGTDIGEAGVALGMVSNNTISENNITKNNVGVCAMWATNNSLYHNNFIDNTHQVELEQHPVNFWDDGYPCGGNYWSNYTGVDRYSGQNQDELGGDGVGDTPHVLDPYNQDSYPLMEPWPIRIFDVTWWGAKGVDILPQYRSYVKVRCYSLMSFKLDRLSKRAAFNVSSSDTESCNVTIPRDRLDGPFTVYIDDTPTTFTESVTGTHCSLCFNYDPGIHQITIVGTEVGQGLGDLNNDGKIDMKDIGLIARFFGLDFTEGP